MKVKSPCIHKLNTEECKFEQRPGCGGYCYRHRKEYLVDNDIIILSHFTSNSKDYTLKELKRYYNHHITSKTPSYKFKKLDYFKAIELIYSRYKELSYDSNRLIKVQAVIRRYLINKQIKLRGIGYLNRKLCNNEEDFYTYELTEDINPIYFFSYKDENRKYWCFDIRSLKKLIDMNYGNPYTIEPIPDLIKSKVDVLINYLQKQNIQVSIDNTVITDRNTQVKQRFVDLFAQIEYSGYSCDVNWILDLNTAKLKRLYKELEDIWNYRANLALSVKKDIVPPDGRLCVMPVQDYINCSVKIELQEVLANSLIRLLGARTPSDMNLGFMYFLIGLSMVSNPCYIVHSQWVQYVF